MDLVVGAGRKKVIVDIKLSGFPRSLFFSQFRASIFRHKKTKAKTAAFLVINPSGLGIVFKKMPNFLYIYSNQYCVPWAES